MTQKHIVAGSAGFIRPDGYYSRVGPILKYALQLTEKTRPKFAYIGTATGDDATRIVNFYHACSSEKVQASHLQLFPLPNHVDVEQYLLSQDIIWVGGGSVANLLATWRTHGLDVILRKAWERGIVLTGQSAGAICWSIGGTTDSFGINLQPVTNGLGFLPYSCGVHYDSEEQRRPLFQKLVQEGVLPDGYATDDGVCIHYINESFHKAVSDTEGKHAYSVYKDASGTVREDKIVPELLSL